MLKMSKNQFIKMMHFPCEWMKMVVNMIIMAHFIGV